MRTVVIGMQGLVTKQLEEVTWKCSNTHMRTVVVGMKELVRMQLKEVTWKC